MQCLHEHLKTIVYAKFGEQTKCIMGNLKIENRPKLSKKPGKELEGTEMYWGKFFGNLGIPRELVLKFRNSGATRKSYWFVPLRALLLFH